MQIPFVDLHAQYLSIKDEIDAAIAEVIANSAYIRGPHVDAFEEGWAKTVGVDHCVSCANGTDDSIADCRLRIAERIQHRQRASLAISRC